MEINWIEVFGYIGSAVVAISLMMSNIKKLRWLNLLGAFLFTIYGAIIGAYPVIVLNAWICLANLYYLRQMYQFKDDFEVLQLEGTSPLVHLIANKCKNDIRHFFPNFDDSSLQHPTIVTLRNLKPVGLLIYKKINDEEIEILVDYVTADVRDLKNAKFLFQTELKAISNSVKRITTQTTMAKHKTYLTQLGFVDKGNYFELLIN